MTGAADDTPPLGSTPAAPPPGTGKSPATPAPPAPPTPPVSPAPPVPPDAPAAEVSPPLDPGSSPTLTQAGNAPSSSISLPPSASQPGALVGRLLGQYRLEEKIGQGGMGAVFRALDTALDRPVAVKVLVATSLESSTGAERFLREARRMARLKHPNLLHVYNVGTESGLYYFAMELLEGDTLADIIRGRGGLSVEMLMPYAAQLLSALHYIHGQGIVHRDVKSGNIMLCGHRAVLMDFGLAKEENSSQLTAAGAVLGTPDYIAPEQAEGEAVGPATDLYSFGVVLYEALSGALPFRGRSAISIIRQHLEKPPPPLWNERPDLPRDLTDIIHRCLAKKPADRYPDCAAAAADLARVVPLPELAELAAQGGRPSPRTAPPARTQPSRSYPSASLPTAETVRQTFPTATETEPEKRTSPWLWLALGFLGVLLAAALLFAWAKPRKKRPPRKQGWRLRSKKYKKALFELLAYDAKTGVFSVRKRLSNGAWLKKQYTLKELRREFGDEFDLPAQRTDNP